MAFLLAELLVIQYSLLNIEHLKPVIFVNLLRSRNLQNKGHFKISSFAVNVASNMHQLH